MTVTATALRQNIYQFLDQSLATGIPLKVKRKEQVFTITPPKKKKKIYLSKLKRRDDIINCDPEELVHMD